MLFLLKEKPDKKGIVRLRGDDYHYLIHVRRLKPGGFFTALLAPSVSLQEKNQQHVNVTVLSIDNRTLTGLVTLTDGAAPALKAENTELPPIIIFQALPKGTKMDLIVRQATEMGISEVVPFVSDYSVPKKSDGRIDRWQRIIKEARQQSLSTTNTRVHEVMSTNELLAYWKKLHSDYSKKALGLILHPQILEKGGFHRYLYNKPPLLVLAVGPEGGFSAAELDCFAKAGFKTVTLGSTILRTETAAIFGTAAAKIILMERAWWKTALQLQ